MRITHFAIGGRAAWGVEDAADLVDLRLGSGLAGLLAVSPAHLATLAREAPDSQRHARADATILCPVAGCGKILGIGMNYHDAVAEVKAAGVELPAETIWFGRPLSALCGPYDPVQYPPGCDDLDYEGELVVVIGKRCHRVNVAEASAAIGGYTIGNDVTMRRRAMRSAVLGKYFDDQAPIGPVIVTADEIADPHSLGVRTWLNGEARQSGNTADMVLRCDAIVAALSAVMILRPGDVIFTGTPAGVGAMASPPRWLQPGDVVRVEVDQIGAIENRVVAAPLFD